MDLLKALKRTTIISTAALLALGATEARADNVAALGHISASVQGTLAIAETSSMNFGNFSLSAGPDTGTATIVLTEAGTRTAATTGADTITLLNGASGMVGNHETGAQRPGFFAISGGTGGGSTVYVSFADNTGNIIDSSYDPVTHPGNYVALDGGIGPVLGAFWVDKFTFATDTGTNGGAEGGGGYTQDSAHATDIYGSKVVLAGTTTTLRVGGTLHTVSGKTPLQGHYQGTYYVMVSY
jgi:hypothetical protein